MQQASSVRNVPPRDLEHLNHKLHLSQVSVVPETAFNMMSEPSAEQNIENTGVSGAPSPAMGIVDHMGLNKDVIRPVEVAPTDMSL